MGLVRSQHILWHQIWDFRKSYPEAYLLTSVFILGFLQILKLTITWFIETIHKPDSGMLFHFFDFELVFNPQLGPECFFFLPRLLT